ncbi:LLM class flavin-dependent oxidoreductase [Herbiconiux sp. A18JL235]|uniref:LLM class flavin-dependent oxidoreductase n=1 Tax=Herbiconiux sp. A18JL235 TaxID=3152363 RepID=A0AB39BD02_9MICO
MRHGIVILPQHSWPESERRWRLAEELGFAHAWTYDHLSWRSLADQPWGASVPTLTAAAVVTSRIRLGLFVASPNFRHPVPFAKELGTLDDVSGGRFVLGVGSGGTGFDASVLGQAQLTPRQRHERFAEFVEQLDALLRYEEGGSRSGFSFDGKWFAARDARMVGTPAQSPRLPFVVAANGPKGLALAARYGQGWVTTAHDDLVGAERWRLLAELCRRLDDALAAAGRDPRSIDRYLSLDSEAFFSLSSVGAWDDAVGNAAELGFTDVIAHWPRDSGIYAGSEEVLVEVASRFAG